MKDYIAKKLVIIIDKLLEGFLFGLGLYCFVLFFVWMGWWS